jgi:uncharacterized protein DUF6354
MNSDYEVSVGQLWADCAYAMRGRVVHVLEINGEHAVCRVDHRGHPAHGSVHRIALRRFRPDRFGYRLVERPARRAA